MVDFAVKFVVDVAVKFVADLFVKFVVVKFWGGEVCDFEGW